jgi:antitoxin ParD1/3/4
MKSTGQLTVTLGEELEQFVRAEVQKRAFASNSEYIRDLVRERYEQQRARQTRLDELNAALVKGLADADAGRTLPLDEAFRKLRTELGLPEPGGG